MHFSLATVVVCAIVLVTWLTLYCWNRAKSRSHRFRQRRQDWEALARSYPDLDTELDQIWQRRSPR
jgi:hypothetical protein